MDDNQPEPKSIEDIDKLIETQQQKNQTSTFGYFILSLFIPPLGLIIASRKKILHLVLPTFTAIYSLFIAGSFIGNLALTAPLKLLQANLTNQQSSQAKLITVIGIILGLTGVFSGLYFRSKAKKEGFLSKSPTYFFLLLIILQFLLVIYSYYYITSSLYNLSF